MRKLEHRAVLLLILALVLFSGLCIFVFRYVTDGTTWAMKYYNSHIYSSGHLATGRVYDRNGVLMADNNGEDIQYLDDATTRLATAHTVGDGYGFVSTSAESAFRDKMVGYNLITGTFSVTGTGNSVHLSIDSDVCRTAYNALGSRNGLVAVYNYKTGQVICMVSTPTFDPASPPSADTAQSGTFMNKFLSGDLTPGSIFKLVTSAAAIEKLSKKELKKFSFNCTGVHEIDGVKIRCTQAHGKVDFDGALAKSCNGAFAEISRKVGARSLTAYTRKCGLETTYDMDGVYNVKGSFEFPADDEVSTAWAGIGQWKDLLNPCSMLVYMGAIANDGESVVPRLLSTDTSVRHTKRMIKEATAKKLRRMMKNDVEVSYGEDNYPGLDIYAKSGTAEVEGQKPNAWFTGFIKNDKHPYAFIVCVEDSGSGAQIAGPVANTVLQYIVNE
ncbi:MAG: penicillin-binding protein [Eubacterium sp.]|nr:penicillin-binding protein [Eubacterium sp.]